MKQGVSKLPIQVSNPGKLFWPEEGYTKLDLIEFYSGIFPKLRPYVDDRILTMERCPDGMRGECFYQKEMPKGIPPGTPTKRIQNVDNSRKSTNYVVGESLKTQLALVNLGCIAVRVSGSRAKTFPKPDWMCIDIDPSSGEFRDAARFIGQMTNADNVWLAIRVQSKRGESRQTESSRTPISRSGPSR
jgi:bifunctional non-homologous end joining protein LigD